MLLCGRYEGVDERVASHLAEEELSIGDFVLSGGELAAAVVVDTVTRLLPGALGNAASSVRESFAVTPGTRSVGLLDCPQYTRPAKFREMAVPEVLLCGDHKRVEQWRRKKALEKTWVNRPDLLSGAALNAEQQQWLAEIEKETKI
jgi:tRNA (guanine37-N1)-methyltransferase